MKNCAGGDSCVLSDMKLPDGRTDGRKERMAVVFERECRPERSVIISFFVSRRSSLFFESKQRSESPRVTDERKNNSLPPRWPRSTIKTLARSQGREGLSWLGARPNRPAASSSRCFSRIFPVRRQPLVAVPITETTGRREIYALAALPEHVQVPSFATRKGKHSFCQDHRKKPGIGDTSGDVKYYGSAGHPVCKQLQARAASFEAGLRYRKNEARRGWLPVAFQLIRSCSPRKPHRALSTRIGNSPKAPWREE